MRTMILLIFSALLLTTQARFNVSEFSEGFVCYFNADENLKSLIKHGWECLFSGAQYLINDLELTKTQDIEFILQEKMTLGEAARCFSTFQTLNMVAEEHLNITIAQENFERSYPTILQLLSIFFSSHQRNDPQFLGQQSFFLLSTLFIPNGFSPRHFINPRQIANFDLPRFYFEFFSAFFEKFFITTMRNTSQEFTRCLNQTHYLIADLNQSGQSIQDQLLGFAIRAPELFQALEECVEIDETTKLPFFNLFQIVKNDPMKFLTETALKVLQGVPTYQKLIANGLEKIMEGDYSEAGFDFGKVLKSWVLDYFTVKNFKRFNQTQF